MKNETPVPPPRLPRSVGRVADTRQALGRQRSSAELRRRTQRRDESQSAVPVARATVVRLRLDARKKRAVTIGLPWSMECLVDDVVRAIIDFLGPGEWTIVRRVCREFRRIVLQRITWAPFVIPTLRWTYSTGYVIHECRASDVVEVESHEPNYNYRTFALTSTSVVSRPCFGTCRERFVHIHTTWVTRDDTRDILG